MTVGLAWFLIRFFGRGGSLCAPATSVWLPHFIRWFLTADSASPETGGAGGAGLGGAGPLVGAGSGEFLSFGRVPFVSPALKRMNCKCTDFFQQQIGQQTTSTIIAALYYLKIFQCPRPLMFTLSLSNQKNNKRNKILTLSLYHNMVYLYPHNKHVYFKTVLKCQQILL